MAEESLKIVLTADNKQAIAAMKETVTSLNQVDAAAGKTGGKVVAMGKDFTGLSRVIQDLPYGFNAISNNLTQLIPAAGAAGLAFSALVAGLSFAQTGLSNWTRGIGFLKDSTNFMNKVSEKFIENIAKERSELESLYLTATNANIPMEARNAAVEKLQKNYGGYLQNISAETIKAGLAADAYMRIVDALDKKAMAQAAEDLKIDKYKELFQIQQKVNELNNEYGINSKKIIEQNKNGYYEITTSAGGIAQSTQDSADAAANASLKTQEYTNKLKAFQRQISITKSSIDMLNGVIQDNQVIPLAPNEPDSKKEKKIKPWNAIKQWEMRTPFQGVDAQKRQEELKKESDGFAKYVQNIRLGTEANRAYSAIARENYLINVANAELTQTATQYTDMAMNSLNGLVNAMINGQNVGMALGDMFKRLAADIALAAAKALIFESLMNILMPGKAAGKAAFGAGKAVAKIFGFASGGTVTGPRSGYPVMLHGTEHIVRPDQMRSIIASAAQMGGGSNRVVVEGRISGNDIFISQKRTNSFRALTT